jgi:hypothetical protein
LAGMGCHAFQTQIPFRKRFRTAFESPKVCRVNTCLSCAHFLFRNVSRTQNSAIQSKIRFAYRKPKTRSLCALWIGSKACARSADGKLFPSSARSHQPIRTP